MTEQTTSAPPTKGLKDALVKRRERLEQESMEGEIEAQPRTNQEMSLLRMEATLAKMLPASYARDPDKAMKMVNNTIQLLRKTPKLALCGDTIMGGVLTAGQLGLELGVDVLGEAYLLPFKRNKKINNQWVEEWEATLIVGYKGYRKLAWQSGKVMKISRQIVYEGDFFEYQRGSDEKLIHRPTENMDERGMVKGYYATVTNIYGGTMFTYMTLAEVEQHRDLYAMAKKRNYQTKEMEIVGPWKDNFNEMALKTVLLKTLRDSPLSIEDKITVAMNVDGSVRRNTDDITDAAGLMNAAIMPQPFNANGINVIEGDATDTPEQDYEPQQEPAPAPEPEPEPQNTPTQEPPAQEPDHGTHEVQIDPPARRGRPRKITETQKDAIKGFADNDGEKDYDLYISALVGRTGLVLDKLTEPQAADILGRLQQKEQ